MSAVAPKPHAQRVPPARHEPEENEAQMATLLDGLLDALDDAMERALRHGLGDRVAEIVARHVPATVSPTPEASGKPDVADLDRVIEFGNLRQFLEEYAKRVQPGSANAKRALHFRDVVRGEIDRIMGRDLT